MNLGEALQKEYGESRIGRCINYTVLFAILCGCAAFEAGNILGAVAGINLVASSIPVSLVVFTIGLISAVLLWRGTIRQIATLLGIIVAIMGICFVATALLMPHNITSIFTTGLTFSQPAGSELLVLGLIGTTVVPYNIFLGSGLQHNQTASEMKLSLMIAIGLGGFVSIAILLTGTAISGSFTFEALADALSNRLGGWAIWLLATGLFGAGLSSALTAALAASITAKSLLSRPGKEYLWAENSIRFRAVWLSVLAIGLLFGMLQFQPIPVIILAQALNGVILPVIAVALFSLMNKRSILPQSEQNGWLYSLLMLSVVYLTVVIGLTNVIRAYSRATGTGIPDQSVILTISIFLFLPVLIKNLKSFLAKNR
jgi:manganese transport protein